MSVLMDIEYHGLGRTVGHMGYKPEGRGFESW
jgi:hypothetical protein